MEKTKQEAPETISMTEADVDRASAREVLREAWMQMLVTKAEKDVTGTGKLRVTAFCSPLNEDGTVGTKAAAKLKLYIPVTNPKNPSAEVAKPKGCYFFFRAIDKNFPKYAKKTGPGKYVTSAGETVDKAGALAIEREVNRAVAQRAVELYNDPTSLLQETFFASVKHETGADGTIYPEIQWTRLEKPEEPVLTEGFTQKV